MHPRPGNMAHAPNRLAAVVGTFGLSNDDCSILNARVWTSSVCVSPVHRTTLFCFRPRERGTFGCAEQEVSRLFRKLEFTTLDFNDDFDQADTATI